MADTKITALTALTAADPSTDVLPIVDTSDTTMAASGTTKKISINNLLSSSPTASGNLTITGDLTVDTSTLKVDSTNNRVGIGTASPAYTLDLTSSNDGYARQWMSSIGYPSSADGSLGFQIRNLGAGVSGLKIANFANSAEWLRIDSSGNLGLGVTPSAWSSKAFQIGSGGSGISTVNGTEVVSNAYYDAGTWKRVVAATASWYSAEQSGAHKWYQAGSSTAGSAITWTQAMTLDASGNLLVGVTSTLINTTRRLSVSGTVAAALQSTGAATVETINIWHTATSGNNVFVDFDTEASVTSRGTISYNRAGGLVAYNTTSDYRAKDIIGPVSDSGSLIDSLKVYVGKMKGATIERPMLIAHELQEVAPYAVSGEKDAVDADGKPKYQQMDASALVPLLIAEIKSLRARVQTLETR